MSFCAMSQCLRVCRSVLVNALLGGALLLGGTAQAGQAPPPPPPQNRAGAPFDLTGTWVSVITEDWRWRMVTPPKGDYTSMPLTPEGRKVADAWEVSQDGSCAAYGAAGLMRMPLRVRISWESDEVLKLESDAGQQTRRLIFGKPRPQGLTGSLQGYSAASWEFPAGRPGQGGVGPIPPGGSTLMVVTTDLSGGWLRRNGVPYSANAKVTEYFDPFPAPNGDEWFVVTTIVEDPQYLNPSYVTSSHFRRDGDASRWDPQACRATG